jgi:hypothetical protein
MPTADSYEENNKLCVVPTDDPRKQQHVHSGGAAVRPTCAGIEAAGAALQ